MRLTPVVTVFITHNGRIAVFRRSDKVGTYKGAWAGVAGYVERLPVQQAYVELQEEAGLTRDDVKLLGMGFPVVVDDANLGRSWAVYPFLFEVADPGKITLDWESDEMKWIGPEEITALQTVPGLDRVLAAVWPSLDNAELWRGLAEISIDTERGAISLAVAAMGVAGAAFKRNPAARDRITRAVAACRPSMGVFAHLAARLALGESAFDLSRSLELAADASARRVAEAISAWDTVFTHSYSSTVKRALLIRRPKHVIVTESRPEGEGLLMARDLAAEGLRVTLIADSEAGLFIREADGIIVGCDAITNDNMIANKSGTSLIALGAQDAGVPLIAVTQSYKTLPPNVPYFNEEQESDAAMPDGVRSRNLVFDLTPMSRCSAVYDEEGLLTIERLDAIRAYIGSGSYSFGGAWSC